MSLSEKELRFVCAQADFTRPVWLAADAGNDVDYRCFKRFVIGSIGRNDAITIETGLGKDFGGVGGVLDGDGIGLFLAEVGEDLASGGKELLAFGCGIVDG